VLQLSGFHRVVSLVLGIALNAASGLALADCLADARASAKDDARVQAMTKWMNTFDKPDLYSDLTGVDFQVLWGGPEPG
jgi:hypothetical protein